MNNKKRIIIHSAVYTALCFGVDIKSTVKEELINNKMNMDEESKILMYREVMQLEKMMDEE